MAQAPTPGGDSAGRPRSQDADRPGSQTTAEPGAGVVDFLKGFELDEVVPGPMAPAAPPRPASTTVVRDAIDNFDSLQGVNTMHGFGATGLMAVESWDADQFCYHTVRPGTIFLFPGAYVDGREPEWGGPDPKAFCNPHRPLFGTPSNPLHAQMCHLLLRRRTSFIGFAVTFPLDPRNVGYNSSTCNPYWFDGSRTLPADWQELVYDALARGLNS
ncbi:MAG: hypothetical protein HOV83_01530 [Catenulispora sp.]|nr:hypothetical protein [Catenulispora sp.]